MANSIDISSIISGYAKQVREEVQDAIEETARDTVNELKYTSPKKTGAYAKSWATKKTANGNVVYNKNYGQLTHLLERSHATGHGGRTKGQPHIEPANEKTIEELQTKVRKAIENAN